MKVLQQGTEPNCCWEIEQTCTAEGHEEERSFGCYARLLVAEYDIYITYSTDYDDNKEYFYTFTCPCCGAKTNIPKHKIIERVRKKVMEEFLEEHPECEEDSEFC